MASAAKKIGDIVTSKKTENAVRDLANAFKDKSGDQILDSIKKAVSKTVKNVRDQEARLEAKEKKAGKDLRG